MKIRPRFGTIVLSRRTLKTYDLSAQTVEVLCWQTSSVSVANYTVAGQKTMKHDRIVEVF